MPRSNSSQGCSAAPIAQEGSAAGGQAEGCRPGGQAAGVRLRGQVEGAKHIPGHRRELQLMLYQWDLPTKVAQVQLPTQYKVYRCAEDSQLLNSDRCRTITEIEANQLLENSNGCKTFQQRLGACNDSCCLAGRLVCCGVSR